MNARLTRNVLLLTACAAALVLSGCGGGGGGGGGPAPISAPPAGASAAAPATAPAAAAAAPAAADRRRISTMPNMAGRTAPARTAAHRRLQCRRDRARREDRDRRFRASIRTSPNSPGKIDPASRDVAANRGITDTEGHGTAVSAVAAAARDGSRHHGGRVRGDHPVVQHLGSRPIATPTTAARTATPTSPRRSTSPGSNGAKVINISLGGPDPSGIVNAAIARAAAAGILVVMSAGNGGDEPGGENPEGFALSGVERRQRHHRRRDEFDAQHRRFLEQGRHRGVAAISPRSACGCARPTIPAPPSCGPAPPSRRR